MPNRKWLPGVLLLIAGLAASSLAGARAADKCLAKPNGPAPHGQHWYYRSDHVHKRQCWYLREAGLPVRQHAPQAGRQAAPQASAQPLRAQAAPPPAAQPQPAAAMAAAAASAADNDMSGPAAPVPFLDMTRLSKPPPAALPAAPAAPAAAQPAGAAGDPPPAGARLADGANTLPTPADKTGSAPASEAPPPVHAPVHQPRHETATPPAPAPVKAAESTHIFALFMLLFAGLAVAGPLFHLAQRRRRAFEAVAFHPPPWARVVALNAPTPRVRVPMLRARKDKPAEHPLAPPLSPNDHNERLAKSLQQLADLLRAEQEPAPDAAPPAARRHAPPRHEEGEMRRAGRSVLADVFATAGKNAVRARDAVRSSS